MLLYQSLEADRNAVIQLIQMCVKLFIVIRMDQNLYIPSREKSIISCLQHEAPIKCISFYRECDVPGREIEGL